MVIILATAFHRYHYTSLYTAYTATYRLIHYTHMHLPWYAMVSSWQYCHSQVGNMRHAYTR